MTLTPLLFSLHQVKYCDRDSNVFGLITSPHADGTFTRLGSYVHLGLGAFETAYL